MSKHPTERVRSVAEMQATSLQQSDKALRRIAPIEERLARLEGRLAERDEIIAEFREAYGRQADTISALTAVVRELEAKTGRGVDQVLTGLEGRIKHLEDMGKMEPPKSDAIYEWEIRQLGGALAQVSKRITALEAKPKRGRPKGSKNKPKSDREVSPDVVAKALADTPAVESPEAESGQSVAPIGQQPEGEPQ